MEAIRRFILTRQRTTLLILGAILALLKAMYPLFNKALPYTYLLWTFIDEWIPFTPIWIMPYVTWYLYLPGVLLLLFYRDKRACGLALLTQIFGLITCYIIYSVVQTTVPRPDVLGTDLFSGMVRLIYSHDQPYNACPSIHVLGSFALLLSTAKARMISKGTKITVVFVGVLIILSTVFVKQHVVLDIAAGITLAAGYYFLTCKLLDRIMASSKISQS